jgi:hypothetical protein
MSVARALLQLRKPARVRLAAFLAVLDGSKTSRAGKIFFRKKMGIWGSTVVAVQILRKIFFRPSWIFHGQEQPKRPPNPPRLASIAAGVLWQRYFNCHNRGPPDAHFFYKKNFFGPA